MVLLVCGSLLDFLQDIVVVEAAEADRVEENIAEAVGSVERLLRCLGLVDVFCDGRDVLSTGRRRLRCDGSVVHAGLFEMGHIQRGDRARLSAQAQWLRCGARKRKSNRNRDLDTRKPRQKQLTRVERGEKVFAIKHSFEMVE
jgi:hypothetical protein